MKKRFLIIPAIAMLFGAGIAFTSSKIAEVKAEEIVETLEESDEQEDKKLYEEALEKLEEIKEKQFVRSLLGAITGGVGSSIVSMLFMFVNRDTMKQSLVIARQGEKTLSLSVSEIKKFEEQSQKTSEKAEKSIEFLEKVDEKVDTALTHVETILANQETLSKEHADEIDLLLTIINSSKDLVANGTAERINKIYRK